MRKEETVIYYRPKIAKLLEQNKQAVIKIYEKNIISLLYTILAVTFKDEHPEYTDLLLDASKCLEPNDYISYETFCVKYKDNLNKIPCNTFYIPHRLGDISEASAARYVFASIQNLFEELQNKIIDNFKDEIPLTLCEKYNIKRFYSMLMMPTRNPNIEISKGHTKCYYDEYPGERSFRKDLKQSIEYINENCAYIIEMFDTPDED